MKRAAIALATAMAFAACANDFDALFPKNPPDAKSKDSGTKDDSVDEPPAPVGGDDDVMKIPDPGLACGAKVDPKACVSSSTGTESSCSGCGCACPALECTGVGPNCTTSCGGGSTCNATCDHRSTCALTAADKGTTASLSCGGFVGGCQLTCSGGATCQVDCGDSSSCKVSCDVASQCLVTNGLDAVVTCTGGGAMKPCGKGVVTCNRDCP